jgi:predicted ArsR family transcriptional regulator
MERVRNAVTSRPMTVASLAVIVGLSEDRTRDVLRRLQADGSVSPAGFQKCPHCGCSKSLLWGAR